MIEYRKPWVRQPSADAKPRGIGSLLPVAVYNGANNAVELVSGRAMTRASAYAFGAIPAGVGTRQTAVNSGIYLSGFSGPALLGYVAVWSGMIHGAASGSTPALLGIATSTTSQGNGWIGLERSGDDVVAYAKVGATTVNRTLTGALAGLAGRSVTMVAAFDQYLGTNLMVFRLTVCADGAVTQYTSTAVSATAAVPTAAGTEVFVVGPDVIELSTRFPNVTAVLAGVWGGYAGAALERRIAANPWQLFEPQRILMPVSAAGGSTVTATTSLTAAIQAAQAASASLAAAIQADRSSTASLTAAVQASQSATVSLAAVVQAAQSASSSVNAAVRVSAELSAALAAAIQVATSAGVNVTAYIQAGTELSASLGAAIQEGRTATLSLGAAIAAARTATANLGAAVAVSSVLNAAVGAAIQASRSVAAALGAYVYTDDEVATYTVAGRARLGGRSALDPTSRLGDTPASDPAARLGGASAVNPTRRIGAQRP